LNFHFWQLITHPFIHNPNSPISFIISCIIFYFFAAPVEHAFGPKRFLFFFLYFRTWRSIMWFRIQLCCRFQCTFFGDDA
jgi:membrane associated rhomboid family serine protease